MVSKWYLKWLNSYRARKLKEKSQFASAEFGTKEWFLINFTPPQSSKLKVGTYLLQHPKFMIMHVKGLTLYLSSSLPSLDYLFRFENYLLVLACWKVVMKNKRVQARIVKWNAARMHAQNLQKSYNLLCLTF